MSFWKGLLGLFGGGFFGGGDNKPKKDPYADLLASLNPIIEQNKKITGAAGDAGLADTATARSNLDYVTKYFKNILEGSPDDILQLFDASELTRQDDENEQQLIENSVRGSRRAAALGQTAFNRNSAINRMLEQLKQAAPDKIANIAQVFGNLGVSEIGAATGAGIAASNNLFGIEALKQADKDRKAELIGSIFEAIGGVAGAVACWGLYGSHIYVPSGKIASSQIEVGDEVLSYNKETGEECYRKVIRKRITYRQITKIISNGNTIIRTTPTHTFYDPNFTSILCGNVDSDDLLTVVNGDKKKFIEKPVKILGEETSDVMIVKLDDEKESYPIIVNGYLCEDDDPLN